MKYTLSVKIYDTTPSTTVVNKLNALNNCVKKEKKSLISFYESKRLLIMKLQASFQGLIKVQASNKISLKRIYYDFIIKLSQEQSFKQTHSKHVKLLHLNKPQPYNILSM